jgi:6,7-dimethyl-8-ribityllumazine synthase
VSTKVPSVQQFDLPAEAHVAIVAARFNAEFVDELVRGCVTRLQELKLPDARLAIHRVPGAFELPLAAKMLAQTKQFDAVVFLACVIRGDTPHFEYVAGECARGIQQAALDTMTPIIFGVLTTNTDEQARQRLGGQHGHAGIRAADAAAEMIALARRVSPSPSARGPG